MDLGFEAEGYDVCYVNEYHAPFLNAYKHSRRKMGISVPRYGHDDTNIECINSDNLAVNVTKEMNREQLVGFIGGPPCPDFSIGGKNRGKDGENGKLSQVYINLICQHKPDFFLFENVKGLYRTKKHREFFEKIKSKMRRSGYRLHERLINSIDYGVPQDRDRIILLGFLDKHLSKAFTWGGQIYPDREAFKYEWPTTDIFNENSMRERKKIAPKELCVQYWFDKNDVDNHPNACHCFQPRAGLERFKTVSEGDDSKKSYKRLHRWRYSPTAAYGNNEVHLHPYKARRITVAEALAIQSLPKEFELPSDMTLTNMFKTVGNGVPYLAAKGLAKSIAKYLETKNENNCSEHRESHQSAAA